MSTFRSRQQAVESAASGFGDRSMHAAVPKLNWPRGGAELRTQSA